MIATQIKQDLLNSGLIPNATKSVWVPVQELEFLGVLLNACTGLISIPDRRILKAQETVKSLFTSSSDHNRVQVRKVASCVGQIISMSVVIGNVSQIMTNYLSAYIVNARSWESYIKLSPQSVEQLSFWNNNLQNRNDKEFTLSQKYS